MMKLNLAALIVLLPLFTACGKPVDTTSTNVIENTQSLTVTAANAPTSFTINGKDNNPTIKMKRNLSYSFYVRALGHPFYILTVQNINPANQYSNGVTGNGVEVGPLTFTVPSTAPDVLYYGSSNDGGMTGIIQIGN